MRIDIITLFPEFFETFTNHSIIGRAIRSGKIQVFVHNLREQSQDSYGSVDDHPYGGGPGMVLRFDILLNALNEVKAKLKVESSSSYKVILMTPQGQVFKQATAHDLAKEQNLILICGHYEGFDERIRDYVNQEISIGDYVLTGGELASMVITDSVVRLLPGVLGDDTSSHDESHSEGLLEYPQYTRPAEHEGKKVPKILLCGNHKEIDKWRKEQSLERTKERRPDLLTDKKT